MAQALAQAGAEVIGPISNVSEAIEWLRENRPIDAAVLDIDLSGEKVFPLADALVERSVPFIFTTGYGTDTIPERLRGIPRIEKPLGPAQVIREVAAVVRPAPRSNFCISPVPRTLRPFASGRCRCTTAVP
jgi:DNA-binding response OmpR family regulator